MCSGSSETDNRRRPGQFGRYRRNNRNLTQSSRRRAGPWYGQSHCSQAWQRGCEVAVELRAVDPQNALDAGDVVTALSEISRRRSLLGGFRAVGG
jgi:hypothetical protein